MSVRELSQSDKLSMKQPTEEYSELLNMFSLSWEQNQMYTHTTFIQRGTGGPDSTGCQKINIINIEKEELKLSLFVDDDCV